MTMQQVVHTIKQQRQRLDNALQALDGDKKTVKRHLSRAARRAISEAAKRRWAERRKPVQASKPQSIAKSA